MTTAVIVGSTGLVGSNMLTQLLAHPSFPAIHAYTRRPLPDSSPKLHPIISTDTPQWPLLFPTSASPRILFSGLGTTAAAAGGAAGRRQVDYDLNLAVARAAKEARVETYVLISAAGASPTSMFSYNKMKGELEDEVSKLGFKHAVFVRPGYIAGERTDPRHQGVVNGVFSRIESGMRRVAPGAANAWAQDAEVIARAAVRAGEECLAGKREDGVWVVTQADIVRLGTVEKN